MKITVYILHVFLVAITIDCVAQPILQPLWNSPRSGKGMISLEEGKKLLTYSGEGYSIWDIATNTRIADSVAKFNSHKVSANGNFYCYIESIPTNGNELTLKCFDTRTNTLLFTNKSIGFNVNQSSTESFQFSPDSKLLLVMDSTLNWIRIDIANKKILNGNIPSSAWDFERESTPIYCDYSGTRFIKQNIWSNTVYVYDAETKMTYSIPNVGANNKKIFYYAGKYRDSVLCYSTLDKKLYRYDLIRRINVDSIAFNSLEPIIVNSPNRDLLHIAGYGNNFLIDLNNFSILELEKREQLVPVRVFFSNDNTKIFGISSYTAQLGCWETRTGKLLYVKALPTVIGLDGILEFEFEGNNLILNTDGTEIGNISTYNVQTGEFIETIHKSAGIGISQISLKSDSELHTLKSNSTLEIHEAKNGKLKSSTVLPTRSSFLKSLLFIQNGAEAFFHLSRGNNDTIGSFSFKELQKNVWDTKEVLNYTYDSYSSDFNVIIL